jgi:hypothetical protein
VDPEESLAEFFDNQLKDPSAAWSVGSFGAIAEFMRDPDEPVTLRRNGSHGRRSPPAVASLLTRIGSRLIASESPTAEAWNHRVALCLPRQLCGMNRRFELTETGADAHALRSEDQGGILFDLGLGLLQVDAFVRATDSAVASALRRHVGKPVFAAESAAMAVILDANPHRVFVSRAGRVEVFQPIPPPNGKSPQGRHTHVLPRLLAHGRTHPATEPLPSD